MSSGRIPSVEGGIQPTIVDAKGDLIVATAADTVSRLAVGTNDHVLTADSSTATGLKWAAASSGALTLITRSTFTSVSSHSVNSVFSSTYDNYRVLITLDQDAAGEPTQFFRLRTSTDATTNYVINRVTILGTSIFNNQPTDKWDFGNLGSAFDMASVTLDIFKPNLAEKTGMVGQSNFNNTTATANIFGGGQTDTTQFTGFTLFGSSGNITGVATVYGYQKS